LKNDFLEILYFEDIPPEPVRGKQTFSCFPSDRRYQAMRFGISHTDLSQYFGR
jgi:hypothetical protein